MLDQLWRCFETTGDVQTYLHFKEYERTRQGLPEGVDEI